MSEFPISASPDGNIAFPYGLGTLKFVPGLLGSASYFEWLSQHAKWLDWYGYIDSKKLDALDPQRPGEPNAWLFPLKINVPEMVAQKHANALFGETNGDNTASLTETNFLDGQGKSSEVCEAAKDLVNIVFRDSSFSAQQHQAAFLSQILGGYYFKVGWEPNISALSPCPIRISSLSPLFVIPIYDPANPWDLLEAHIVYDISKEDAKINYGVEVETRIALYHEHWTRKTYSIEIGGQNPTLISESGMQVVMKGANPWGFVPIVYIPHYLRKGQFYGTSHVPPLEGISTEYNSSLPDRGDAVKQVAGNNYWMRNTPGSVKMRKISEDIRPVVDLGTNNLGKDSPEIERFETGDVPDGMATYTNDLWSIIERVGSVPAVVWGADEGSQRSSLTLAFRTWPMTSHINKERTLWTAGLMVLSRMILLMAINKSVLGATEEMRDLRPVIKWPVIMPRDRMEEVNEMAIRVAGHFASIEHAVRALSTGEDVPDHLDQIKADLTLLAPVKGSTSTNGTEGVVPAANSTVRRDMSA